jgi:hypothetical protein
MARGFSLPVQVNRRGGAKLLEGTPYTEQVIRVGLTPNYSDNPFQAGGGVEVGISERYVFATSDPVRVAAARRDVQRFFARLRAAEIAKLGPGAEGFRAEFVDEELVCHVGWIDLEADAEGGLASNLKDALRAEPRVNASGR